MQLTHFGLFHHLSFDLHYSDQIKIYMVQDLKVQKGPIPRQMNENKTSNKI